MKTTANVANIPFWQNLSLENLPDEIWRPVKGLEGMYEVSNYSRVKSVERIVLRKHKNFSSEFLVKAAIKKPYLNKSGYITIAIVVENKIKTTYLHRIIAEAFVSKSSENYTVVNHINGNKSDNRIENLEWVSSSINNIHALDTGLRSTRKSMTKEFICQVLELRKKGLTIEKIAFELKTTESKIQGITSGTTYKRIRP